MRAVARAALPLAWLGLIGPALGAENALPSCYAFAQLEIAPPKPRREVIVLVDQTTPLGDELKRSLLEQVSQLIIPGTAFTVASFSAFSQGRFTQVRSAGSIEAPVPSERRPDLSVNKLKKADACLKQQAAAGRKLALDEVSTAVAGASNDLAKSDVLASLKQLSSRASGSAAKDRIVIVVSDMLEHSSVTSFYHRKALRKIDAAAELAKAKDAHLTGNFGGARVYVIGGASLPGDGYRGTAELSALENFWSSWFANSSARLVAFGTPVLMQPIR